MYFLCPPCPYLWYNVAKGVDCLEKYENYSDEQLLEAYEKLVKICNEYESLPNGTGRRAKEDIENQLRDFRNKKFAIAREISKRGLEKQML